MLPAFGGPAAVHPVFGAPLSLDADPLFEGAVPLIDKVSFAAWAQGA